MKIGTRLKVLLFVKPPGWVRWLTPGWIWRVPAEDPVLYLTFDDGPIPGLTGWILEELEKYGAKATFFCVGDNVIKYPALYAKILAAGHRTGNHTYSHLNNYQTVVSEYVEDVIRASGVINSSLFRPPYGRIRPKASRILKDRFHIILWDVLSMDYDRDLNPEEVYQNVISNASPGSIVVFHDNIKARENLQFVLPRVLEYYSKAGFRFRELDENLFKVE